MMKIKTYKEVGKDKPTGKELSRDPDQRKGENCAEGPDQGSTLMHKGDKRPTL